VSDHFAAWANQGRSVGDVSSIHINVEVGGGTGSMQIPDCKRIGQQLKRERPRRQSVGPPVRDRRSRAAGGADCPLRETSGFRGRVGRSLSDLARFEADGGVERGSATLAAYDPAG
jgi:hypothetical protein